MANNVNRIFIGSLILGFVLLSYFFKLDFYLIIIVCALSFFDLIKSRILQSNYLNILIFITFIILLFSNILSLIVLLILFIISIIFFIIDNKFNNHFFIFSVIIFLYFFYLTGINDRNLFYTLIFLSFINDTLAYIFGNLIKGPLIVPKISPKKTWSGTLCSFTLSFFLLLFLKFNILFSLIISISYFFGDLIFSYYKRKINIKDFSSIFNSHGGILDRLDSMFLIFIFINIPIFASL